MGRRRRRVAEVADEQLLKRHFEWLSFGPLGNFLECSRGPLKKNDVTLADRGVYFKLSGAEQIHRYGTDANGRNLSILGVGLKDSLIPSLREVINRRVLAVPSKQRHDYNSVFGSVNVQHRGTNWNNGFYEGVAIEIPVVRLPAGIRGGLSDSFFAMSYNLLALPLLKIVWGVDWKDLSVWHDFSYGGSSSWKENVAGGGLDDSRFV